MRVAIYLAALVCTVFCTAVNLYTWRVAYPLWRFAGEQFAAVHREYLRRLDLVITVPHVAMFFASGALVFLRPGWAGLGEVWVSLGLNTLVILVSIAVARPVHDRFSRTGLADEPGMRRLVQVSGLRSALMVVSCAVLVAPLAARLGR